MSLQGTKALEKWCRTVTAGYDGVNIANMSSSWRNGLGFCAVIHHFRPDLLDFDALDADNALENNQLAFEVAEQHLSIPALLDAKDMVECQTLDRLSILTYLSQFHQVFHGATSAKPVSSSVSSLTVSPTKSSQKRPSAASASKVGLIAAGRPNEPCIVCLKPVFILERFNVGGRLLHRTCFKCARCRNQLNMHNYYETEDGQYCCDMCPDEERSMSETIEANKKIVEEHLDSAPEDSSEGECEHESEDESHQEQELVAAADESEVNSKERNPSNDQKIQALDQDVPTSVPDDTGTIGAQSALPEGDTDLEAEVDIPQNTVGAASQSEPNDATSETRGDTHEGDARKRLASKDESAICQDNPSKDGVHEEEAHEEEVNDVEEEISRVLPEDLSGDAPLKDTEARAEGLCRAAQKSATDEVESVEEPYPESKNPFEDGDEQEREEDAVDELAEKKELNDRQNAKVKKESTNPFGSEFEESSDNEGEESEQGQNAVANPLPKPPRVSLNPFGSDFEDDEDSERLANTVRLSQASPSPSGGVTRARKKRPAPQPPSQTTPTPSPRSSKHRQVAPVPTPRPCHIARKGSSSSSSSGRGVPPPRPAPPKLRQENKQRKDLDNQNRRSQQIFDSTGPSSSVAANGTSEQSSVVLTPLSPDKAIEGQWKKKKGPAPPRPIPPKRQVKKLPRKAVNTELHDIEVQQQELERQGVALEKTIRELCEKNDRERSEQGLENNDRDSLGPEVEDLIIQLFDLVNEKNLLFRRQAELMYMKRDHRLEEEYVDIEHQIRLLISKPESQRSPADKELEDGLLGRMMEIVAQRNEIVECLEMDRRREREEDESIESHLCEYATVKPADHGDRKDKKKKKDKEKVKKLIKIKRKKKEEKDKPVIDADKDIDTSEFPEAVSNANSPKKQPTETTPDKDKTKQLKKKILKSINKSAAALKKT